MNKVKTRKSIAKRIKVTGSGKLMARRNVARHLVARKSKRTVSRSGKFVLISDTLRQGVKRAMPYS